MKAELHSVAKGLAEAEIDNTGVKTDPTLQKLYVAFKDPDRIQCEFYMMEPRIWYGLILKLHISPNYIAL
jgi:hypothetical protein